MILLKYALVFCVFSIIGYIIELTYRSFMTKKIINPGFMTGFVVPLYGFGAVILNIICDIISNVNLNSKVIFVFILSIVLLSLLEYITGYILLYIFNIRLWDYSMRKYNINGFVCLRFSIYWGILSLAYYLFIFNFINKFSQYFINNSFCAFTLIVFYLVLFIDLKFSINKLIRFRKIKI